MMPTHRTRNGMARTGLTLFEVILAIALSAALLALIGTAINLYLTRIHASRVDVEEAQLARTILGQIGADIRAATVYLPQDTSGVAQLMAAAARFDVDSIDDPGLGGSGSGGGAQSGSGSSSSPFTPATGPGGGAESASQQILPLGLNGTTEELIIDVNRLPGADELFSLVTGYTNFPSAAAGAAGTTAAVMATPNLRPSDLKSARYFVRHQGSAIDPGGMDATRFAPQAQYRARGLVRQEIDRAVRTWAEQTGNQAVLDAGQQLLAPEVVRIEFYYFDGMQVTNFWDMRQRNSLPLAIEVRLWLVSPDAMQSIAPNDFTSILAKAREYRQTVYLPMAAAANSAMPSAASSSPADFSPSSVSFGDGGFGFSEQ